MTLWRMWLVALHLILLLLSVSFIGPKLVAWFSEAPEGFGQHYENMLAFHLRGDAALPPGRIILLGDSLVQGLPVAAVSDLAVNYGIGNDNTFGLLNRLPNYESLQHASAIVLAIGINDMRLDDNDAIEKRYQSILDQLPANVPVLCNPALPVDERVDREWNGRSNDRYEDWNERVERLCETHGGTFIPVPVALLDDERQLAESFHSGDGLHLNADGNRIWAAEIRLFVQRVLDRH